MSAGSAAAVRRRLAEACHVLYAQGQDHLSLGHVSARTEPDGHRFWVKPAGLGLGEVEPDHLVLVDLEGRIVAGTGALHRELPIHTEVYRARPDVCSIVHTHAPYAAAFSATSARFLMLGQDSVLFAGGFGWYDSARLVVTREQGCAVAAALGRHRLIVLRNHGIVTADTSIESATFHAIAFDRSLRLQATAERFGPVREMTGAEVGALADELAASQPGGAERMFDYLLREATAPDIGLPMRPKSRPRNERPRSWN